jgi:leucyl aminopeptidase
MTYKHISTLDTSKDFILPCGKDQLDTIKELLPVDQPDFDGSFSTYLLLYGKDGNRIYLLGLGEDKHSSKLENTFYKLAFETQKHWDKSIQVYAEDLNENEIRKAIIGLQMAQYTIGD